MHVHSPHAWRLSVADAVALQDRLRHEIHLEALGELPRLVGAADAAYSPVTRRLYAAAVVVSLPSLDLVDVAEAERMESFPYIPGLFAFRELPVLADALERLRVTPEIVLFDAHGIAHPRRCGLASHASLLLDVPTIGCAKCMLMGHHDALADERGASAAVVVDGNPVGTAVRTRAGVMPVYVSPGNRVDVASAARVVLAATGRYRTPEPLRRAHMAAVALRRRVDGDRSPRAEASYADLVS